MYQPTTRVLTVLELLQTHGRLQRSDLAARLEVGERSVRRYITMLQDLGVPVTSERGRHGGYRLRPGFKLPPLMFTDDEALALTLGLLAARQLGLAAAAPAVEGALAKIERVLPATLRARVQAVGDTIVFDLPPSDAPPWGEALAGLSAAVSERRRVRLRYQSPAAETETEREVDPYGLVYRTGRWYMVGHCHLRRDLRVFRLDRVRTIARCDETFSRPADFDPLAHVLHAIATVPRPWTVVVLLETTLAEARRWMSPAVATLEEVPGGILLRSRTEDLDSFARHLVRIPCPLIVREPPELRAALRRLAGEIAALAERAEG